MAKKPPKKASGTDFSKIMKTFANAIGGVGLASIVVALAWVPLFGPFLSAGILWLNLRILQPSSSAPSSVSSAVSSAAKPAPPDANIDGYPAPMFPEFRCEEKDDLEYYGGYDNRWQDQSGVVIELEIGDTRYARTATIRLLWQGDKNGKSTSFTSARYFDGEYFYCDIVDFLNKNNDYEEFDGDDSTTVIFRVIDEKTLQLVSGHLGTLANGTILKKV